LKIVVYSYFPPLKNHLAGGAQRFLDGLLKALLCTGEVEIIVLSPPLPGRTLVPGQPGLRVLPELALVDGDPTPAHAHQDLAILEKYCAWADVVLTIDRHFPLQTQTPVVLCLNNFSYGPETRSVFGLSWDAIVVPSSYLQRCVGWYFAASNWIGSARPIQVIPCGVDRPHTDDAAGERMRESLRLSASGRYLAFPHRPDRDKGFETAVEAAVNLKRAGDNYTLLVPSPKSNEIWPHQRAYLEQRREFVRDMGAEDSVQFHRWIRADEMAAYLNVAEWSLCLSRLPEGFGLSVLEGIVAGVPVVATPSGAVPEVMPAGLGVELTEFGDANTVARIVAQGTSEAAIARGQAFIASSYSWKIVAERWLETLSSTKKSDAMYAVGELPDSRVEPWRRPMPSGRVWDDYRMDWVSTQPSGVMK
jgi:glycosyltransferase involved in cell wall biosynthesis